MCTCNSTKPITELFNKSFHLFFLENIQEKLCKIINENKYLLI